MHSDAMIAVARDGIELAQGVGFFFDLGVNGLDNGQHARRFSFRGLTGLGHRGLKLGQGGRLGFATRARDRPVEPVIGRGLGA